METEQVVGLVVLAMGALGGLLVWGAKKTKNTWDDRAAEAVKSLLETEEVQEQVAGFVRKKLDKDDGGKGTA